MTFKIDTNSSPHQIYNPETMTCLETVPVGWRGGGGLADMAVAPTFNQLVGASLTGPTVTTYIADVKSCAPFTASPVVTSSGSSPSSPMQEKKGGIIPLLIEVSYSVLFVFVPAFIRGGLSR